MASEDQAPTNTVRLHQITDDDLAVIERLVPLFVERLYAQMDNKLRAQIRQVQQVIVNVRWNYGPPGKVVTFGADEDIPREEAP